MTVSEIMGFFTDAMIITIKLSAPILLISMGIGLIISIFQAATQIHEQTLSFVPKLIAIIAVLLIMGSWMSESMMDFLRSIFTAMGSMS